jgi:hypothetical protein
MWQPFVFGKPWKAIFISLGCGYIALLIGVLIYFFATIIPEEYYERSRQLKIAEEKVEREIQQLRAENYREATRIEVNAALHALYYSDDDPEENMRIVISFADEIEVTYPSRTPNKKKKKDDALITGYTPRHGNITIDHQEKDNGQEDDREDEAKIRIGQFRLWRCRSNLIAFHHFWAAEESTRSHNKERAHALYIQHHRETLQPECLAGTKEEYYKNVRKREVYKVYLDPLWGELDPAIGVVDFRVR